jgi:hypothetical protein
MKTSIRHKVKYIALILVIILIIVYIYLRYPTSINRTYTGLKYRLGVENMNEVEEVTITINGKITKDFWLNKRFEGKFFVDNVEELFLNKEHANKLEENSQVKFDLNRSNFLEYIFFDPFDVEFIGTIYIDEKFNSFTIKAYEPKKNWSSKDGLMITAPVTSRVEAIEMTNKLMERDLKGKKLY